MQTITLCVANSAPSEEGCPKTTPIKVTVGWSLHHLAQRMSTLVGACQEVWAQSKMKWDRVSEKEGIGRYLLGAFGGLFGQVVVCVVGLCDATEQHGHDACGKTHPEPQFNDQNTECTEVAIEKLQKQRLVFLLSYCFLLFLIISLLYSVCVICCTTAT